MQRRCSPTFAFCWKRLRLSGLRARGLEMGASQKAEEGRRGGWHIQSRDICGCITVSLFLVCA